MRSAIAWAAAAAAFALAAPAAQALNKCTDASGKVTYQETACPSKSKQDAVKFVPRTPPASAAAPAKPAAPARDTSGGMLASGEDRPDAALEQFVATLALYEGCEQADPQLVQKHRAEHDAWRTRNAALLEKIPHSRRYMLALQSARQRVNGQLAVKDTRAAFVRSCESRLLPSLAQKDSR